MTKYKINFIFLSIFLLLGLNACGASSKVESDDDELSVDIISEEDSNERVDYVKSSESEEKTTGGIIIPDSAKEKPMEGQVLEVGSGARDESGKLVPLDVKKGDKILFGKWSGTEVKMNGEDYLIMKESDIMGIITSGKSKKKK